MPTKQVKISFPVEEQDEHYPPVSVESLWCIPLGGDLYKVDNIPFYARGISLGDVVEARPESTILTFRKLVEKAANSTVRVVVLDLDQTAGISRALESMGCAVELSDIKGLLSISIPNSVDVGGVLAFLDSEAAAERVGIEESSVRYR